MELVRNQIEPATTVEPWSTLRRSRRLGLLDFAAWEVYIIMQLLDVATTTVGLSVAGGYLAEGNPAIAAVIGVGGLGAFAAFALVKLAAFVVIYRSLPRPFGVLVPVIAAVPTTYAVASNVGLLRRLYDLGVLL